MLIEATEAAEIRRQVVTADTLRLSKDAQELQRAQAELQRRQAELAAKETELRERISHQIRMEAQMQQSGQALERRMGCVLAVFAGRKCVLILKCSEVSLWRQEREEEVQATRADLQSREEALVVRCSASAR